MPHLAQENIGHYVKACVKLNIKPTFETPDLFESKNMRAVSQNIHALARAARGMDMYAGPLLGSTQERMIL